MKKFGPLIVLIILLCIGAGVSFYIYNDPKSSMRFNMLLSKMGLSETGAAEQYRLDRIDALDIPFEQREALKKKTIFMGATKTMVKLAFGITPIPAKFTEEGDEVWVYYFNDYDRPIYLIFKANILVKAKKGSNADMAETK